MAPVQTFAIYVLVFSLPFNGLRTPFDIGELSGEGFFFGSLLYLALIAPLLLAMRQNPVPALLSLAKLQSAYIFSILVISALSLQTILSNDYGLRTGPERFFVSLLTYGYYFALSVVLVTHALYAGIERFLGVLGHAFVSLGIGLAAYCSFEVASWFSGDLHLTLVDIRSPFAKSPLIVPFRLSGVSLEPSFNAFALLACVPWIAMRSAQTGKRRYLLLAILLIFLCLVSGARTAYAGLVAMALMHVLLRGYLSKLLPNGLDGAFFIVLMFAVGLALPSLGLSMIDADAPTSNVTRAYLANAAIEGGLEHISGQGFGQATFFAVRQSSALIQYSWELMDFFYGSRHGVLPPLYSWYARTFGEFGSVGYVLICAGFAFVAARFFACGHRTKLQPARSLFFLGAMVWAQSLAMALSVETIRLPQFWLAWVLIALFFLHTKARAGHV